MYHNSREATSETIVIRRARESDREALERVAQRDGTRVPGGELLVALDAGELRAAVAVDGGTAIADPFHRTAELLRMLSLRAAQLRASPPRRGGLGRLLRGGRPSSPQPAGALRPLQAERRC